MRAAQVNSFDQPLEIVDLPRPAPGPEQALVRIEACGLCHTDVHAAHGEWPVKPTPPFTPGHEGVGLVEDLGTGGKSHGLEVGDRVALPWLGYACGDCRYCNTGRETLCPNQLNMGYSMNGGFADFAVGYSRHLVKVPDGVDPLDAAPLTCAGVTTFKAVKVSGAGPSSLIAVFGVGGLGHLAVQYARASGSEVVAVDINQARLDSATELGAEHTVNALEQDPVAAIQALGGADAAISTAVTPSAFEQALSSLARGGTLVCVGLPADNGFKLPIFETVLGGLTVKGSIVGTHRDLEEVFDIHQRGLTRVMREERPLEEINEAISALLDGSATQPRTVLQIS